MLTALTLITLDFRANGGGITGDVRDATRTALSPVGSAVSFVLTPVGNVVGGVLDFGRVRRENARLRDELADSRSDVIAAQDAQRRLKTVLDEIGLTDSGDIPTVAATVTGSSAGVLQFTLEIDKGSSDGIAQGMPVVSGGALVGRIVRVTKSSSTVRLLSDPSLGVGVRVSRTGDLGVATGDGGDLDISLVAPTTEIKAGDDIVTSGLQQSQYPPDLPIGKVVSAKRDDTGLAQNIRVRPVVNLRRLSFVRVLLWSPE